MTAERQPPPPQVNVPDLLIDSTPTMDTKLIDPSSPTPTHSDHPAALRDLIVEVSDNVSQEGIAEPTLGADEAKPDTTIRLVGGGGLVGIAPVVEEDGTRADNEAETDVASVASAASDSNANKGQKTHKKTKSGLAGLKKLGHLGGLRKRDSNNSMKVPVSPSLSAT
jgi:hypothetical protein